MKGFIFDMDGTMIDNMMVHHRAWQHQLEQLGIHMTLSEVKEKVHGVNVEILERLFGDRFSPTERQQISSEKEAAYRRIFLPDLKLIDGLQEFLNVAMAAQIPMAVASAAPPENVNFVLDNLQLRPYFKAIFHSGNVSKGKPHPEVFQQAAAGLNLSTTDCLVFEDSVTGAETAANAGCPAVIITTTHRQAEFAKFDHIQKFINDFSEVTLSDFFPKKIVD